MNAVKDARDQFVCWYMNAAESRNEDRFVWYMNATKDAEDRRVVCLYMAANIWKRRPKLKRQRKTDVDGSALQDRGNEGKASAKRS